MDWQSLNLPGESVRRTMHFDEAERKLIVNSYQDCEDILAFNQALYNAERSSSSLWGGRGWVRVASIPDNEAEKLIKSGRNFLRDPDAMKSVLRLLSTNEFEKWRTAPGRLA